MAAVVRYARDRCDCFRTTVQLVSSASRLHRACGSEARLYPHRIEGPLVQHHAARFITNTNAGAEAEYSHFTKAELGHEQP